MGDLGNRMGRCTRRPGVVVATTSTSVHSSSQRHHECAGACRCTRRCGPGDAMICERRGEGTRRCKRSRRAASQGRPAPRADEGSSSRERKHRKRTFSRVRWERSSDRGFLVPSSVRSMSRRQLSSRSMPVERVHAPQPFAGLVDLMYACGAPADSRGACNPVAPGSVRSMRPMTREIRNVVS
jgi:hypothetical protein